MLTLVPLVGSMFPDTRSTENLLSNNLIQVKKTNCVDDKDKLNVIDKLIIIRSHIAEGVSLLCLPQSEDGNS